LRSGFIHAATPSDVTLPPEGFFSNFGESPDVRAAFYHSSTVGPSAIRPISPQR